MNTTTYFNGNDEIAFIKVPMALFTKSNLSIESIILYSFMRNRAKLSIENNWIDRTGKYYIIYALTEIQKLLKCGHDKATKTVKELEKAGLIEKIVRYGKPTIYYVCEVVAGDSGSGTISNTENSDVLAKQKKKTVLNKPSVAEAKVEEQSVEHEQITATAEKSDYALRKNRTTCCEKTALKKINNKKINFNQSIDRFDKKQKSESDVWIDNLFDKKIDKILGQPHLMVTNEQYKKIKDLPIEITDVVMRKKLRDMCDIMVDLTNYRFSFRDAAYILKKNIRIFTNFCNDSDSQYNNFIFYFENKYYDFREYECSVKGTTKEIKYPARYFAACLA